MNTPVIPRRPALFLNRVFPLDVMLNWLVLALLGGFLHAQDATPRVSALNAVIDYRVNWLEDSTSFDACSIYRSVAPDAEVTAGLLVPFRERVSTPAGGCIVPTRIDPWSERRVIVDSIPPLSRRWTP